MKKLILILVMLVVALFPSVALAATIPVTAPIFWYGWQGDYQKGFTGSLQASSASNNDIQTVTFVNNNFDNGTYETVNFWEQVPAPASGSGSSGSAAAGVTTPSSQPQYDYYTIGSTDVYGNGNQTVTCPAGTNIVCFYGSAGGQVAPTPMPWAYVSQETDSAGNTYTLPAPTVPH